MTQRDLTDRINEGYAEAWRPAAGEAIVGEIVEISSGDSKWGPYPIVTIKAADGSHAVHAFHSVLKSALVKAAPAIGETIAVKYEGPRRAKNAAADDDDYHSYRVVVDRAPEDLWAKFTESDEK